MTRKESLQCPGYGRNVYLAFPQAEWPINVLLTPRASAIYNQMLQLQLTLSYVHFLLTEASPITKPGQSIDVCC
jgi:hypothetical protein